VDECKPPPSSRASAATSAGSGGAPAAAAAQLAAAMATQRPDASLRTTSRSTPAAAAASVAQLKRRKLKLKAKLKALRQIILVASSAETKTHVNVHRPTQRSPSTPVEAKASRHRMGGRSRGCPWAGTYTRPLSGST